MYTIICHAVTQQNKSNILAIFSQLDMIFLRVLEFGNNLLFLNRYNTI